MDFPRAMHDLMKATSVSELRDVVRSHNLRIPTGTGASKLSEDEEQFWKLFHSRARELPESNRVDSDKDGPGISGEVDLGKLRFGS
jgi:hypothetical protein